MGNVSARAWRYVYCACLWLQFQVKYTRKNSNNRPETNNRAAYVAALCTVRIGLITVKSTWHQANIKTLTTRTMLRDDQWHVTRRVRGLSTRIVGIYSDLSGLRNKLPSRAICALQNLDIARFCQLQITCSKWYVTWQKWYRVRIVRRKKKKR